MARTFPDFRPLLSLLCTSVIRPPLVLVAPRHLAFTFPFVLLYLPSLVGFSVLPLRRTGALLTLILRRCGRLTCLYIYFPNIFYERLSRRLQLYLSRSAPLPWVYFWLLELLLPLKLYYRACLTFLSIFNPLVRVFISLYPVCISTRGMMRLYYATYIL